MSKLGKIVLVGGTGFVGRALCRRLATLPVTVDVIGRRERSAPMGANTRVHLGNVDDVALMDRILCDGCTVFYMASDTTPGSHPGAPTIEVQRNMAPALRFIESLQRYRDCNVIFFSSGGTIYGSQLLAGTDESRLVAPLSYYGATKTALEGFFSAYQSQFGAEVTVLRPSNLYGPDQEYRVDFGAVRKVLECLLDDVPFEIWGDGENIRDYLYIEDFVDACLAVLNADFSGGRAFRIFNVGAGLGHSVNEVCAIAESATGRKLKRIHRDARAVDVRSNVLDSGRIETVLGWHARTTLSAGIARTWNWLVDHG